MEHENHPVCECGSYEEAAERAKEILVKLAEEENCLVFLATVSQSMAIIVGRLMADYSIGNNVDLKYTLATVISGVNAATSDDVHVRDLAEALNIAFGYEPPNGQKLN